MTGLENKVLVLGNSPFINQIDFNRLPKDLVTIGVNRIWLKHIPTYFFFNDSAILTELSKSDLFSDIVRKTKSFSSDWLTRGNFGNVPNWLRVYPRINQKGFPDSVTTAIQLYAKNIAPSRKINYYIAGVSLKWTEPSHFWKEQEYSSLNDKDELWYTPRFNMILNNFKNLKSHGFKMISVTPDSQLNKIFRYENIENLYST